MRTIKAIFVILTVGIMALAGYALVTGNRAAVLFLCWATLVDGMLKLISMVLTDDPPPAKPARLSQFVTVAGKNREGKPDFVPRCYHGLGKDQCVLPYEPAGHRHRSVDGTEWGSLKADETVPIPPVGPIARMMRADDRTRRTY